LIDRNEESMSEVSELHRRISLDLHQIPEVDTPDSDFEDVMVFESSKQ